MAVGQGADAAPRADVDDASVRGLQMRIAGLSGKKRAAGIGFEHGVPLFRSEDSSAAVSKRAALFTSRSGARSVRWRRPRRCVPLNRFLVPLILNTLFRFVKSIMPCSAL